MVSWIVPSDAHVPSDTGHTNDHNHIADDLTLIAQSLTNLTGGKGLLIQVGSGYANGTFVAPGDGAQYSNFNLADNTYPLDQNPGGHYWAFSHRADSPIHRLLIFNYNGAGTYTNVVTILESGSFSTLHNTLDDGNGNLTVGASTNLGTGTAATAPLKFTSGTLNTTPTAGVMEYDGTDFYATAQASARQVIDTEQFITLTSPYTLTSQTAAQKLFNATTNGALTVEASTTYWFECFFTLSSMSASSGAYGFALGGTATLASQMWETEGNKATLATAASAQNTVNTAANVAIVTATTATVGWAKIWGKIRVNAAGTLIPQVSLGVAAAAVVGADSYFRIWPAGASAVTNVGNWS